MHECPISDLIRHVFLKNINLRCNWYGSYGLLFLMRWQDALGSQSYCQTWTVTNFGSSFLWAAFFLLMLDIWPQINTLVAEIFSCLLNLPVLMPLGCEGLWPSMPLKIWIWFIIGHPQVSCPQDSAKCRLCGTMVLTVEQIPYISGPSKFKPVLFKVIGTVLPK